MITEHDLQEAIAECQGQRNPNANTCIKLASYLTIYKELYGVPDPLPSYSFDPGPPDDLVSFHGDSEFAQAVDGKQQSLVWPVINELMDVVYAINPNLYQGVMDKLTG